MNTKTYNFVYEGDSLVEVNVNGGEVVPENEWAGVFEMLTTAAKETEWKEIQERAKISENNP
jgi:hypothetical protein